jgi:large subunit ribosomal protein L10
MDRASKEAFVADFQEKLGRAQVAVVADFRGLDVDRMTEFRKALAAVPGTEFRIVKNRLAKLAVAETAFSQLDEFFTGPNAVLLGFEDAVEAAKVLTDFARDNAELAVKGGAMEGNLLSAADVKALANLPPKEVLQSQLLGVLQGPMRNLVSVLANVNRSLLNVVSAYKDKLESGEEAGEEGEQE